MSFLFNLLISRIYKVFLASNTKFLPLELSDRNCLCLAPHADDESIGMGGTLLQYGELFDIICLTNGSLGISQDLPKTEKTSIRKEEFLKAMEKLKVKSYDFWQYCDDRSLILNSEYFSKINIADYDYIFLPNIIDQHRDHKATSILLKELLKHKKYKKNLKIVFYEIWQTLALPNFYIDISSVTKQKLDLLQTYKSQIANNDYTKILGLNNYRGLAPHLDSVEAFCVMDIKMFKKICKIYNF